MTARLGRRLRLELRCADCGEAPAACLCTGATFCNTCLTHSDSMHRVAECAEAQIAGRRCPTPTLAAAAVAGAKLWVTKRPELLRWRKQLQGP